MGAATRMRPRESAWHTNPVPPRSRRSETISTPHAPKEAWGMPRTRTAMVRNGMASHWPYSMVRKMPAPWQAGRTVKLAVP